MGRGSPGVKAIDRRERIRTSRLRHGWTNQWASIRPPWSEKGSPIDIDIDIDGAEQRSGEERRGKPKGVWGTKRPKSLSMSTEVHTFESWAPVLPDSRWRSSRRA